MSDELDIVPDADQMKEVPCVFSRFDADVLEARLTNLIDAEFEITIAEELAGLKVELDGMVVLGYGTATESKDTYEERKSNYAQSDLMSKLITILNNFHLWWQNGWYRATIDRQKQKRLVEAFLTEMDRIVTERGYDLITASDMLNEDPRYRKIKKLILVDVYLALRELGFDRSLMIK